MKNSSWFAEMTRRQQGSRRWVNLPFIVVLGGLATLGFADGERLSTLWPYIVLLLIFLFQCIWPTLMGWILSISSWLLIAFGYSLFERIAHGIGGFSIGFLCIWGVVPAVLLCFFRPRSSGGTLQ
jgi:hypothetical protein